MRIAVNWIIYFFKPAYVTWRQRNDTWRILLTLDEFVTVEAAAFQLQTRYFDVHVNALHGTRKAACQLQAVHWNFVLACRMLPQRIEEHIGSKQFWQVQFLFKKFWHGVQAWAPLVQRSEMLNYCGQIHRGVFWAFPLILPIAWRLLIQTEKTFFNKKIKVWIHQSKTDLLLHKLI